MVFNFPRPLSNKPSLLNYEELRTLLHEFGHALHGIFSQATYRSLSGTSVYRDFVELPSQIMENWAEQIGWLKDVGKHFETGKAIPDDIIEKLLNARYFNKAFAGCRQLSFGYLDFAWHMLSDADITDVVAYEAKAVERFQFLSRPGNIAMSPSFNHIFAGGYAAGYYGYKWAEVLDADAFSKFTEAGIFNQEVAAAFRKEILERGGTRHPLELYTNFVGREPSMDALLKREGLRRKNHKSP